MVPSLCRTLPLPRLPPSLHIPAIPPFTAPPPPPPPPPSDTLPHDIDISNFLYLVVTIPPQGSLKKSLFLGTLAGHSLNNFYQFLVDSRLVDSKLAGGGYSRLRKIIHNFPRNKLPDGPLWGHFFWGMLTDQTGGALCN